MRPYENRRTESDDKTSQGPKQVSGKCRKHERSYGTPILGLRLEEVRLSGQKAKMRGGMRSRPACSQGRRRNAWLAVRYTGDLFDRLRETAGRPYRTNRARQAVPLHHVWRASRRSAHAGGRGHPWTTLQSALLRSGRGSRRTSACTRGFRGFCGSRPCISP